jgi:hypothetical protein
MDLAAGSAGCTARRPKGHAMPTRIHVPIAKPARRPRQSRDLRKRESWFAIVTMVIVTSLAAVTMIAAVAAFGAAFLPPLNGP